MLNIFNNKAFDKIKRLLIKGIRILTAAMFTSVLLGNRFMWLNLG